MPTFLGNWEVESDLVVPEGIPFLRYEHPASSYTVFLRNIDEKRRDDLTFISMQLVFDAPTLDETRTIGEQHAKEFLDYLAFTTNLKVRLRALLHIYSWEQNSELRDGLIWSRAYAQDDAPYNALIDPILSTVNLLQTHETTPGLRRALKWFSTGIAARVPDEQFTYFWFVIEHVAQIIKATSPVPTTCPTCRSPLFCETCGASPLHRPYPKQAIEQLFSKYITDDAAEAYDRLNTARNMLMHGEETATIERELQIEFTELVNRLGALAWVALLNQFVPVLLNKKPTFLETNQYVRMNLSGWARIQTAFVPNFANPDPKHFPDIKFTMVRPDQDDSPSPAAFAQPTTEHRTSD
jgi:hypothetical protein